MSGLPPPPYYTRPSVMPSSEYIQRSPFEKQELYADYQNDVSKNSFWQNNQTPNSYFRLSTLGRSVLPELEVSQLFAKNYSVTEPITLDIQKALWTAQVLAFWLTDGFAYRRYDGMEGLISRMGLDPKNPSAVLDSNGLAFVDLRTLLNPSHIKDDPFYVKGPDSLFGPELESVLEEYAGTRKLFGHEVPEISKPILEQLITQVSTPKIKSANADFSSGNPRASRSETVETPCSMLLEDARLARKDCRQSSTSSTSGASGASSASETPSTSKNDQNKFAEGESSNSKIYLGLALIAIGASAYYIYSRKNKKDI